jgi:hypothetical protein
MDFQNESKMPTQNFQIINTVWLDFSQDRAASVFDITHRAEQFTDIHAHH